MTAQDIIQAIITKNANLTEEQIKELLAGRQQRTGNLIGEETLLRLLAAEFGVQITQDIRFNGYLSTGKLFAGLHDVTVVGRLIAVYPVRSFQGEKSGKFSNLMICDNEGILRVVLWNEKAELVEKDEFKVGDIVRLLHGYTREDRYGKVELHLGLKSSIVLDTETKPDFFPSLEKFATKILDLKGGAGVHLVGSVREVFACKQFTKDDASQGTVLRFTLSDASGGITVVAWDQKAQELEKQLKPNLCLELMNAKVKETEGKLEVHLDSGTCVNLLSITSPDSRIFTKIASIKESHSVNIEGEVSAVNELKQVTTAKGETIKLLTFTLKDDTGQIKISVWREQAVSLGNLQVGDKVSIENAYAKEAYANKAEIELSTCSGTSIMVKKP